MPLFTMRPAKRQKLTLISKKALLKPLWIISVQLPDSIGIAKIFAIILNIAGMGYLQLPGLGKVHFHEYGQGTKPMLAFHGYGMTGKQFHVLEQSVMPRYKIYGFDHFFHGDSRLE